MSQPVMTHACVLSVPGHPLCGSVAATCDPTRVETFDGVTDMLVRLEDGTLTWAPAEHVTVGDPLPWDRVWGFDGVILPVD